MGELKQGIRSPHWGNCLGQKETFKAEDEAVDLWKCKWNEIQTVLGEEKALNKRWRLSLEWATIDASEERAEISPKMDCYSF